MRFSSVAIAAAAVGSATAATESVCDKYTTALLMNNTAANQYALVTLLVKTAALGNFTGPGSMNPTLPGSKVNFSGLLAPGTVNGEAVNLAPYFSGALASSNVNNMPTAINWLDGGNASDLVTMPMYAGPTGSNQLTLLSHLVSYFGVLLGCTMYGKTGFPAYAGSNNQYNVHKYMDLSEAEFTYFIQNVGMSALSFGASQSDVNTVAMSLNGTFGARCAPAVEVVPGTGMQQQVMCIGSSCPLATNAVAGCSGNAAVAGYTPSMPASASMTAGAASAASGSGSAMSTGSATMTNGSPAMSSEAMTTTGGAAAATTMAAATGANSGAGKEVVAAGLMVGAAAVAAALL